MRAAGLIALLALPAAAAPKAPDFSIAKVLGAPVDRIGGLKDLSGEVVYLEFWATWCAPCVAGMPRTNRLIETLAGEPVVFLAVTDEPETVIAPFLEKREVKAWVGIDVEKKALKPYKVRARPRGFLIGKDGTLLAQISPEALRERDIREALAGTFHPRTVLWDDGPTKMAEKPAGAALELSVSTVAPGGRMAMSSGAGLLEFDGVSLGGAVSWLWEVSDSEVFLDKEPAYRVRARLAAPGLGDTESRRLMQAALQAALGVSVLRETRELDVYLLSAVPGAAPPPAGDPKEKPGLMNWGGGRLLGKVGMAEAAQGLSACVGRPVIDETGLAGEYALDLEWKDDEEAARDAALAAVGLRLVPVRRAVPVLRVAAAAEPDASRR